MAGDAVRYSVGWGGWAVIVGVGAVIALIALLAGKRVRFTPPQIFKLSEVQKTHALLDQGLVSGKLVMHP